MGVVYYCGFTEPSDDDCCDGNNGCPGQYTEQQLRLNYGITDPVIMEMLDTNDIKSNNFICLCKHVYLLRNNKLLRYTPGCTDPAKELQLNFLKSNDDVIHSIYAEPGTDRILVVVYNYFSNNQDIYAFHEKYEEQKVLSLKNNQQVEKLSCGHCTGILATQTKELFLVTECKSDTWSFHHLSTPTVIDNISCGKEHVIALSRDGDVYTMGSSTRGQLGLGSTESRKALTKVESLEPLKFVMVTAGGWHSLVLSENGDLYGWGWNECGQVGSTYLSFEEEESKTANDSCHATMNDDDDDNDDGDKDNDDDDKDNMQKLIFLPTLIDTPLDISFCKIDSGSRHSAAVTNDGDLYTWGWNGYGQLCHGDQKDRISPHLVEYFRQSKVVNVYCGPWSIVIVTDKQSIT